MPEKLKIIFKVDLQCERCYKKIKRTLDKLQDQACISSVVYNEKNDTVTLIGDFADPKKLIKKICCKACNVIKDIQIVSDPPPPPPPKPEPKPTPAPAPPPPPEPEPEPAPAPPPPPAPAPEPAPAPPPPPPPAPAPEPAPAPPPPPAPAPTPAPPPPAPSEPEPPQKVEPQPPKHKPVKPPKPEPECSCPQPRWNYPCCCCRPYLVAYYGGCRCCSCGWMSSCSPSSSSCYDPIYTNNCPPFVYGGPCYDPPKTTCHVICDEEPSCVIM